MDRVSNPMAGMQQRLRRIYFLGLLPAIMISTALLVLGRIDPARARAWAGFIQGGLPWLFGLSVALAVAGPVMVRAAFAHGIQHEHRVSAVDFFRFRRRLVAAAVAVPYLALLVVGIDSTGFFRSGILLAALYALYYGYPSRSRVDFDRRLFRVEATG